MRLFLLQCRLANADFMACYQEYSPNTALQGTLRDKAAQRP